MDPPPREALVRALEMLYALGALNDSGNLTEPLGAQMVLVVELPFCLYA